MARARLPSSSPSQVVSGDGEDGHVLELQCSGEGRVCVLHFYVRVFLVKSEGYVVNFCFS